MIMQFVPIAGSVVLRCEYLSFTSLLPKLSIGLSTSITFIIAGEGVSSDDWEAMTIDQMFDLHRLMQDVLIERLTARRAEIESQLKILNQPSKDVAPKKSRDRKFA